MTVEGVTTTMVEPEWDDFERDKMLALDLFEAELCECGIHKSIAHDPDQWFDLDAVTCPLCADVAARMRATAEADRKEDEALKDQPGKKRRSDGRVWSLRWRSRP